MELQDGIRVAAPYGERYEEVLTPEALMFLGQLHNTFEERRGDLLTERGERRGRIAAGEDPDFLAETKHIREDTDWRVAPPAPDLEDRRVEMTGPTTRSMTVNALNSGAKVWLADFEDATSPTWHNVVAGQLNLIDALDRRIDFTADSGKEYRLGEDLPTIVVRPRGWHLPEQHLLVNGSPLSGSLVDFGLYFFHCAKRQLDRGSGPYFYLAKLENHLEARLWNDVFCWAQDQLAIPRGTIRATVLIETITAVFEMEEILYELRDHSAGLNAGRWDYIFSLIKNFRTRGQRFVLPDRAAVTMTTPFMRAYTELLVRTCHRRGAHAIGGMAAFVPDRRDEAATAVAFDKVRGDKERESEDGFDGSWVAHPDLVPICRAVFDQVLGQHPNQLDRKRDDVEVSAADLLAVETAVGDVTEAGLRANVRVSLGYLDAWLGGNGAVAIDHLMEDAATVEIARSQVWQWLHYGTALADGRRVTPRLVDSIVDEELARWREERPLTDHLDQAREVFTEVALGADYPSFSTIGAYTRYLVTATKRGEEPRGHPGC
jgi:malate synthase